MRKIKKKGSTKKTTPPTTETVIKECRIEIQAKVAMSALKSSSSIKSNSVGKVDRYQRIAQPLKCRNILKQVSCIVATRRLIKGHRLDVGTVFTVAIMRPTKVYNINSIIHRVCSIKRHTWARERCRDCQERFKH